MDISNIMAVGDDLINRKMVEITPDLCGYQTLLTTDGSEAIEVMRKVNIDLGLKDLQIEDPDGFAVLKKATDLNTLFKGVVITGDQDGSSSIKAKKIGVEEFQSKLSHSNVLLECVKKNADKLDLYEKAEQKDAETYPPEEQIYVMMQMMSYNISSALTSVRTSLELLEKKENVEIPKEVADELEKISSGCRKLATMVEENLDKTYSLKHKINIEKQKLNLLDEIIRPVLDDLRVNIKEESTALDNLAESSLERISINGDRAQLKEVFRNLFKKTFKYDGNRFTLGDHLKNQHRIAFFYNGLDVPKCHSRWVDR